MSLKYIGIVSDKLINYLAPFWPSRPSLSWRWRKKYFANIETSYQRIKCVKRQKKIDSWKTFNCFRPTIPSRQQRHFFGSVFPHLFCWVPFAESWKKNHIDQLLNLRFPCRSRTASRRHESNETVSAWKILSIYETECAFVISNNKNRGKFTDLARAVALRFTAKTKLKFISINFWIHDFPIDLELLVVDVNQTKQFRLGKFSQSTKLNVLQWYRIKKTEANLPTWPGQLDYNSRQKRKWTQKVSGTCLVASSSQKCVVIIK